MCHSAPLHLRPLCSLYLGFHSPSLLFHPVVLPTCLWQQHREVAALTASGPKPSGSKEQHAAPGLTCGPNFSLFSKKCIHSACLGPKTLVEYRAQMGSSEKEYESSSLVSSLAQPHPLTPFGFLGFAPEMSQAGPFLEAAGVSWLKWHLPGPFHILVLLPFASCQSSPLSSAMLHGSPCLSWSALNT